MTIFALCMPAREYAGIQMTEKQQKPINFIKTMKKGIKLFSAAILGLAAVACSSKTGGRDRCGQGHGRAREHVGGFGGYRDSGNGTGS